jgi:hypothetical protein
VIAASMCWSRRLTEGNNGAIARHGVSACMGQFPSSMISYRDPFYAGASDGLGVELNGSHSPGSR